MYKCEQTLSFDPNGEVVRSLPQRLHPHFTPSIIFGFHWLIFCPNYVCYLHTENPRRHIFEITLGLIWFYYSFMWMHHFTVTVCLRGRSLSFCVCSCVLFANILVPPWSGVSGFIDKLALNWWCPPTPPPGPAQCAQSRTILHCRRLTPCQVPSNKYSWLCQQLRPNLLRSASWWQSEHFSIIGLQ